MFIILIPLIGVIAFTIIALALMRLGMAISNNQDDY